MEHNNLSLMEIMSILKKNIILILFVTLLSGSGIFALSYYVITPKYTATASMYVHSKLDGSEITSFDLTASQELVSTYIVIIKSDTVLDKVISDMKLNLTAKEIRKGLEASSLDETEAFSISYTHTDPKFAQAVVNKVLEIAPNEIMRIVQAGGVEIIDYAKEPVIPASPNIVLNTVVGTVMIILVTIGICIIVKKLDTKIHTETDLARFSIPVLGIIPVIIK